MSLTIFIAVVPIVFFSLLCSILSLNNMRKVGRIGARTLAYYLCTTAGAIVLALAGVFRWSPLGPVMTRLSHHRLPPSGKSEAHNFSNG